MGTESVVEFFHTLFHLLNLQDKRLQSFRILVLISSTKVHTQRILQGEHLTQLRIHRIQVSKVLALTCINCKFSSQFFIFFIHAFIERRIENPEEQVRIQHILAGIFRKSFIAVHQVGKVEVHHSLEGFSRQRFVFFRDNRPVLFAFVISLHIVQRRQQRKVRTFLAVIPPKGKEDIFHPFFPANVQSRLHGFQCITVGRSKPKPAPSAACKPHVFVETAVRFDHCAIIFFLRVIIIPVDKVNFGYAVNQLLRDEHISPVILPLIRNTEEHIRPHHRFKAVLLRNFHHFRQVLIQKFKAVMVPVFVQILPKPHHMRFVHTDMDFAGGYAFRKRSKHIFNQFIRAVIVNHQNIRHVTNTAVSPPSKNRCKVRKRLDTRNKLHPLAIAIRIDFLQLILRIRTTEIAEIRLVIHFIRVFRVKLQHIISKQRKVVHVLFHCAYRHNAVPRHIQHYAKIFSHFLIRLFILNRGNFPI